MSKKSLKPSLRFKGFTDDWEQYKFSDLFATIKSGNRLPKDMVVKGDIPYVIARIDNNGIHDYISEDSLDYHSNSMKLFKAPSITFSIDNPDAIFVQETAYFTSNIMRVLQDDKYNLYQYILFSNQLKKLTSHFNWSIKFSGPVVLNSEIRLPYSKEKNEINLEEVTKLGKLFYQLDHLITLHQREVKEKKCLKRLHYLFITMKNG